MDISRIDPAELTAIDVVVEALTSLTDLDPDSIMVVGAQCRNILHSAYGHKFPLRSTGDIDVGIALSDWSTYTDLVGRLTRIGHSGIRYLVEGIPVDLLPFGDVEHPTGTVTPAQRKAALSVFAFREVFERALTLPLGANLKVRIPSPSGYTALKMYAWCQRSIDFDDRDAPDLATAAFWYQESTEIADRLYTTKGGQQLLEATDWNVSHASAKLLSQDIAAEIGLARTSELNEAWSKTDVDYLATRFGNETLPHWPDNRGERELIIDCLGSAIQI